MVRAFRTVKLSLFVLLHLLRFHHHNHLYTCHCSASVSNVAPQKLFNSYRETHIPTFTSNMTSQAASSDVKSTNQQLHSASTRTGANLLTQTFNWLIFLFILLFFHAIQEIKAQDDARYMEQKAQDDMRYEELQQELSNTNKLAERITGIPFSTINKGMHLSQHAPSLLDKYHGGEVAQLRQQYEARIAGQEAHIAVQKQALRTASRKNSARKARAAALQKQVARLQQEIASQKTAHEEVLKAHKKQAERDEAVIASLENQLEKQGEDDDDPDLSSPQPSIAGDATTPKTTMIKPPHSSQLSSFDLSNSVSRSPSRDREVRKRQRSAARAVARARQSGATLDLLNIMPPSNTLNNNSQKRAFETLYRCSRRVFPDFARRHLERTCQRDCLMTDCVVA
jgi:hypothetical protein